MITLTQEPNMWNLAYVPNVFVLDGMTTEDSYLLQVMIDGTPVSTSIQPANPVGVAMFDVAKILQSYLKGAYIEDTAMLSDTPNSLITYQVRYGSITDGIATFDGLSAVKHALNGYDNYDVINWDYTDYIPEPTAFECISEFPPPYNTNAVYSRQYEWLTNWPTYSNGIKTFKVRPDEHRTLSFFNIIANYNSGDMWGPNESPFFIKVAYYNAAGSLLGVDNETITSTLGLGTRVDCNDNTSAVADDNDFIGTIGVGPWNIQNSTLYWAPTAAYYIVSIWSKDFCVEPSFIDDCTDEALLEDYLGYKIYEARFDIEDPCTKFQPINVSFVNQYGQKDYYTFDRRNEQTTNIARNNYTRSLGSWSDASFTISNQDRGNTTFSADLTTQLLLKTNWMTDAESKWLEELFISPSVMIFYEGVWRPVVVNTASYQQKTFARDTMFQHEITVEFANKKKVQRG